MRYCRTVTGASGVHGLLGYRPRLGVLVSEPTAPNRINVVFGEVIRPRDEPDQIANFRFVLSMRHPGWDGLDSFLSEIADSYRGWEGTKSWASPEGDLKVEAEPHHRGHNTLRFTARDGPNPTWWATATAVVAASEDMANLASSVKSFLSPLRST